MSIELRGRISATAEHIYGDTEISRRASFYATIAGPREIDIDYLRRSGRELEEQGYDSALYPVNSRSADVWAVAAEALAATRTLTVVSAHRLGLQQPTQAARAFATLDRVSGGRAKVHLILGGSSVDLQRDGEQLDKDDRYRRALEYAEIFRRTLESPEPFDYDGEFYTLRGAYSDLRPLDVSGRLSYAGLSEQGLELAARFADTYAVYPMPLKETADVLARVAAKAAGYGRTLTFWRDSNLILADEDQKARDLAEELVREVNRIQATAAVADKLTAVRKDFRPGDAHGRDRLREVAGREDWHDKAFFTGLTAITAHGPCIVGSPATAAEAYLEYYKLGVSINTVGGLPLLGSEDRELQAEFFRLVREGAARIDAERHEADVRSAIATATV